MTTKQFSDHPILIIDGHNLFIRGFIASPQMDALGEPIGGVSNFLKTLRKLIETMSPSHCFVTWDAGDGSEKRRKIYPMYKHGRKARKVNREYPDQQDSFEENKNNQLIKLIDYLKYLPVKQFFVEDCEADDVIAQICLRLPKEKKIVIYSGDRDFYQLIDERISVYNPNKKLYITHQDVIDEFGASPRNVLLSRIFLGDSSDNINGVNGIGPKWIDKNLPFLKEEKDYYITDLKKIFKEMSEKSKLKMWKTGHDNFGIAERNLKLMMLSPVNLNSDQQKQIYDLLEDESEGVYKLDKLKILKLMNKDGLLSDFNFEYWFEHFVRLLHSSKQEQLFTVY